MKAFRTLCAAATAVAMSQCAALAGFIWAIKSADDATLAAVAR